MEIQEIHLKKELVDKLSRVFWASLFKAFLSYGQRQIWVYLTILLYLRLLYRFRYFFFHKSYLSAQK